jgi:hypothetical protein
METSFRPLDVNEMGLLEKLLSRDFPSRDDLRHQLSSITGRKIDNNGSLELRPAQGGRAEILRGSPTEETCPDIDGGSIAVMLHVRNGQLHLLEIFKEDGSEILRAPDANALSVY